MAARKKSFQVSLYQHGQSVGRNCVQARTKSDALRKALGPGLKVHKERPGVVRVTDESGRFTYVEFFVSPGCR
jgi:hypothetical protein